MNTQLQFRPALPYGLDVKHGVEPWRACDTLPTCQGQERAQWAREYLRAYGKARGNNEARHLAATDAANLAVYGRAGVDDATRLLVALFQEERADA